MKLTSLHKWRHRSFRPRLESLETRLTPTTYTVSSLADSGEGSLRAAITSVNADAAADEIDFSVAGVIKLTSGPLPAVTNTVNINGRSAPGFTGAPVVELDNNGFAGLILTASNSSLKSLSIVNAGGAGVTLKGVTGGASGSGSRMTIVGNYIGLALDGSVAANTGVGLLIDGSSFDTIGGRTASDRNVISGNGGDGIQVGPSGQALDNVVLGNLIGTDPSGLAARPNFVNGITILANVNSVGGFFGYGNTIAFNLGYGILVNGGMNGSSGNSIQSNSIFSNGSGIKLVNNGNQNQSAPRLSYAVVVPGSTPGTIDVQVGGILKATPFATYTVQVFATPDGVPEGQGQLFLGWVQVFLDANGVGTFTLSASIPAAKATFTATAANTTPDYNFYSNTSEFSNSMGASTPNQVYVANAYQLLLKRGPDDGANVWVNALNNGVTPAAVALAIANSEEYLNDQVVAMYQHYLFRSPDPAGEQNWTNFLLAGGTLEQVAAGLVSSQEFFVLEGSTYEGFVYGIYTQILHRGATRAEFEPWVALVDKGVSRLAVAGAFLSSQEYRGDLVMSDYLTFLLRSVDAGGLAIWVNALNAGATDQQVLAQIFGSAEGYQYWS
jgi:hypothetical protein